MDIDFTRIRGYGNSTDSFPLPPIACFAQCFHRRFAFMQPWIGDTSQKGDLNSDSILAPANVAIALRLAATDAHDPTADVSGDNCITSPGRAHDSTGGC